MSDDEQTAVERLQAVMTALLERQLGESLKNVDAALALWRQGDSGVFETHSQVLRHAARAERLADRMARIGLDNAECLLRDAYDCGLVESDEFFELVGKRPEDVTPSPPLTETSSIGLPNKRELIEEMLGAGPVLVHVDARNPVARVPEQFRGDPKLVLRFGYGLTPAIIDLSIDDETLSGTLTFSGVPHRCVLPWQTVYAVISDVDQKGMVWPDEVPDCVVESLDGRTETTNSAQTATRPATAEESSSSGAKPGSHLKLVK